jgi:hypothetical protein
VGISGIFGPIQTQIFMYKMNGMKKLANTLLTIILFDGMEMPNGM